MREYGKLLQTKWLQVVPIGIPCFTCKYKDIHTTTTADIVRVRVFENMTVNTYFCTNHGEIARSIDEEAA